LLYVYPAGMVAVAVREYARSYDDPIAVAAGIEVVPDPERSAATDISGWVWCKSPDGREGWVPEGWLEQKDGRSVLKRDFSALELSVRPGDRIELILSESGFAYGRTAAGEQGWVPDGVLTLPTTLGVS
jgi:hypothetical protein